MNEAIEKVVFQLTGKKRLEDVSLAELNDLSDNHPYFSIGHLLLSKKLQQTADRSFDTQVQRTAAYFHNTLWLDYLLQAETPAIKFPVNDTGETKPLLDKVIREEQQTQMAQHEKLMDEPVDNEPEMIIAVPDEEQYAASTTEEVMQQAEDEEKQKEVIASVLEDQLAEFKKPVTAGTELKIQSEPYYTVDYFASLGIKIDLSQPQDKLGTQVRKFTDWLKQMKSVKPASDELASDPEVDNMIQGIAKTSNETKEIVTETMAQVLVKQGKTDKAIQLYIKLSFLNPDKSAYFAAKIEQLKGI
jgi:hypothetical protein